MTWELALSLVLTALAVVASALWLSRRPRSGIWPLCTFLVVAGAAAAMLGDLAEATAPWHRWLAVGVLSVAAVVVGAAATVAVLQLADREAGRAQSSVRYTGLRGGAWIGVLERVGSFAALAVHLPEGMAVILAIKGLARYPELRAGQQSGVAERFIIGTFTSMAVAAGCAGLLRLLI